MRALLSRLRMSRSRVCCFCDPGVGWVYCGARVYVYHILTVGVLDFIRDKYKSTTGKDVPISDK